jgi:hypothetical protein
MKKNAIILIFSLLFLPVTVYADEWEEIRNTAKNIKSVSAEFTQEKHLRILSRPLVSQGRFYFTAPGSLRWEYISPVRSILMMHNGRVKSYIEGRHGLVEDTSAKEQVMGIVIQEITSWLSGRFHDDPNFEAELFTDAQDKIVLMPKEASFSNIIRNIELVISRKEGAIKAVRISESADSYTLIRFTGIRHNKDIDERLYREAE